MKSVLFVSALVSFVLLLGRLSGFVRETLLAATFGPTAHADAAIILLTLPDLMVGLLLAGGFNAVLIPAIKQVQGVERIVLVRRVALFVGMSFVVLASFFAAIPDHVMGVMAPALEDGSLPDLSAAFRISLLALPVVALIGVAAAYLNSVGRFAISNISVLLFNAILCLYLLAQPQPAYGLLGFSIAIVVASVIRLGLHLIFMKPFLQRQDKFALVEQSVSLDSGFAKRFFLGVLGLGVTVAAPVVFRTIYALTGEGNLSLFNFALKLFELPSAILIAPVVIVMIPKLAGMAAPIDRENFDQALITALTAGIALGTSAAAVTWTFALPITQTVYGYGAMTADSVAQVAGLSLVLMLALPFLAVVQLCAAGLSAQGLVNQLVIWPLICLCLAAVPVFLLQHVLALENLPIAAMGLTAFFMMLAGSYLFCLFGFRLPSTRTVWVTLLVVLRATAVSLPFAVIMAHYGDRIGQLGGVGLACFAGVLTILANMGPLRALWVLRIDTR